MGADITCATRTARSSRARAGCAASASSRPTSAPAWRCCIAALCAEGRSEIGNIRQIDRGYERIDERLRELGARIERVATEPVTRARPSRVASASTLGSRDR